MTKETDERVEFVRKARIVSENLIKITRLIEHISPDTVERETIAEITNIIDDIVKARNSVQRFRAMEELGEHAEHGWLIRLAIVLYASKLLDIESFTELNGTSDIIHKLQEEANEPIEEGPSGNDGEAGADH